MLSRPQALILSVFVVFAIRVYVIRHLRRVHSRRPAITTDSVETSEFGQGTLAESRCLVAALWSSQSVDWYQNLVGSSC